MSTPNTISYSVREGIKNYAEYANLKSEYDSVIARVKFVLLDDSNKQKFEKMKGWRAIGSIECIPFINFNDPKTDPIIAKPLNSNITRFPLVNELVLLKVLVSKEAQNNLGNYKPEIYYTDIISVFNAPEDNATPDSSFLKLNPSSSITGDYISSGKNKRLIKAPGDVTVEGRRGNSIRFGSNTPGFTTPWKSEKASPILLISNNPSDVSGSVARFEDVNTDGSILVMMSGHNIGFQAASNNFQSYKVDVSIPEKNNYVVTDQTPKSKPEESLKEADEKPIPKEEPRPNPIPVATPEPVKEVPIKEEDDEEMPEREDLMQIQVDTEEVPIYSAGRADGFTLNIPTETRPDNSRLGNYSAKKFSSSAKSVKESIDNYIATNNEFLKGIVSLSIKYSIPNYYDILRVIQKESIGKFEKAALVINGEVKAAGLIQFTRVTLPLLNNFGITNLNQILTKSALEQLKYVDAYFKQYTSKITGGDIYAIYGVVFYPYIVEKGRIRKELIDSNFIFGSERNPNRARVIGKQNPGINGKNPITMQSFINYVNSLYK
jgi:hypothetical protein